MVECLCLVNRPLVEAEWFMPTRDRPLVMMVVLCGLCYRWVVVESFETGQGN
jgi:hypothetical protein